MVKFVEFYDIVSVGKYIINPEEVSSIIELRRGCIITMKNGTKFEVTDTAYDARLKLEGII